jgi:excisionase family DNA binding protein
MNNAYETSGTSPTLFEPLLSDVEAGKLLGLHAKTLQRLARKGEIPSFKIQKYWKYRASELNSWLQSQRNGTLPSPEEPSAPKRGKRI